MKDSPIEQVKFWAEVIWCKNLKKEGGDKHTGSNHGEGGENIGKVR